MNNNNISENIEHFQQKIISPTVKFNGKLIFSSNEKNNLWEFFSNHFLSFKFYPLGSEIEEELNSIHKMIKIFENWKSTVSTKKMSLIDFCKTIEKYTLHTQTQDYRLRALYKYKSIRKVDSERHTGRSKMVNDHVPDLKLDNPNQNLESKCGIDEKLKARREMALKRRKLLLTNKM